MSLPKKCKHSRYFWFVQGYQKISLKLNAAKIQLVVFCSGIPISLVLNLETNISVLLISQSSIFITCCSWLFTKTQKFKIWSNTSSFLVFWGRLLRVLVFWGRTISFRVLVVHLLTNDNKAGRFCQEQFLSLQRLKYLLICIITSWWFCPTLKASLLSRCTISGFFSHLYYL